MSTSSELINEISKIKNDRNKALETKDLITEENIFIKKELKEKENDNKSLQNRIIFLESQINKSVDLNSNRNSHYEMMEIKFHNEGIFILLLFFAIYLFLIFMFLSILANDLRSKFNVILKDNVALRMYSSRLESEYKILESNNKITKDLIHRFENEINLLRNENIQINNEKLKYKLNTRENSISIINQLKDDNIEFENELNNIKSKYKKSKKYIKKLLKAIHLFENMLEKQEL
jgi:hypothetical protein